MADTDECAQRACLRIAEVTVMHSVITSATGSTATETAPDLGACDISMAAMESGVGAKSRY